MMVLLLLLLLLNSSRVAEVEHEQREQPVYNNKNDLIKVFQNFLDKS